MADQGTSGGFLSPFHSARGTQCSTAEINHCAWLFTWVLGIWTEVLGLAQQVLLPAEPSLQLLVFAFRAKISLHTSDWPQLSILLPQPPKSQDCRRSVLSSGFIGTEQHLFILLPRSVFTLQQRNWKLGAEVHSPTKWKVLSIWLFIEEGAELSTLVGPILQRSNQFNESLTRSVAELFEPQQPGCLGPQLHCDILLWW